MVSFLLTEKVKRLSLFLSAVVIGTGYILTKHAFVLPVTEKPLPFPVKFLKEQRFR